MQAARVFALRGRVGSCLLHGVNFRDSSARFVCIAVCLLALAGCATKPKAPGPAHRAVGTVVLVNEEERFVLIDAGTHYPPAMGQALKSFSGGAETAVLALSKERRQPFLIADIIKGEPRRGDQVFE